MPELAFLENRFMPLGEAVVPVEDRGYQFGDGVYEVIRTYQGRPFELQAHLRRFERSAQAIGLTMPLSLTQWGETIDEGVRRAGFDESKVYLQLTRGVAPRDHAFPPAPSVPTMLMTIRALRPLDAHLQEHGVAAITLEDWRWARCDIKSLNLLPNVLAKQRAREKGVFEAIFLRAGMVTEGAVSNVMAVTAGRVITPPEGPQILSGVTRSVVLELARKAGVVVEERPLSISELRVADEVILTGTTIEVLPVVRLDAVAVGPGSPGPIAKRLLGAFRDYVAARTQSGWAGPCRPPGDSGSLCG